MNPWFLFFPIALIDGIALYCMRKAGGVILSPFTLLVAVMWTLSIPFIVTATNKLGLATSWCTLVAISLILSYFLDGVVFKSQLNYWHAVAMVCASLAIMANYQAYSAPPG